MVESNIKVGDVVLHANPTHQFARKWNLCRVVEVVTGPDGHSRFYRVLRIRGDGQREVVDAHASNLSLLEGAVSEEANEGWPWAELLQHPREHDPQYYRNCYREQHVSRQDEAVRTSGDHNVMYLIIYTI